MNDAASVCSPYDAAGMLPFTLSFAAKSVAVDAMVCPIKELRAVYAIKALSRLQKSR
jgi:hypothetical protein